MGAYLISCLFGDILFYPTPVYFMLLGIRYALTWQINSKSEEVQRHEPS